MSDRSSDQEIIKESNIPINNKNTKYMRAGIFKRFLQHLQERNKPTEIEKIENLDEETCHFISCMKQKNGQEYNWNSYRCNVHNLFGGIKDYYQSKDLKDYPDLKRQTLTFSRFKKKLSELKVEKRVGKRSPELTKEEELKLFKSLDLKIPEDLLVAAFWSIAIYADLNGEENFMLLDEQVKWSDNGISGRHIQVFKKEDKLQSKKQRRKQNKKKSPYQKQENIYDFQEKPYNPYSIITDYKNSCSPKKTDKSKKFWKSLNRSFNRKTFFENRNIGRERLSQILNEKCRKAGIEKWITLYPLNTTGTPQTGSSKVSKRSEKNVTSNYGSDGYNHTKNLEDQSNSQNIPQDIPQNSPQSPSLPLIQNIAQNSSLPLRQLIPKNSSLPLRQNNPQNSSLSLIQNIPQNSPLPLIQNIASLETQQESVLNYNQGSSLLNLHLNPQNRGITMATGETGPVFNFNGGDVFFTFNFNVVNSNVERKREFERHITNHEKKKK
ncbi:hypothetical protein M0812_15793 [Anaeramoeba flamelloides]|uniref:Uncharacterized protein n=1 Tax=Anaeramoeba flamelloides TaxID=1746091 RepID=A0AAV7ZCV0_9EUKA|nr:hypothetical protein M0812_15793 [Anaeramoeba flamelloides]